ncbi:hypothetical protein A3H10_03510 [Candidatus Uhrbacteria bacterium RIFCSPLOWO2_12_FULL_46_10]|uniref:Methyltransferase type 11 domain-containing protein n=1 Tax=Candidatus Uhrbacteria bacterium RIFCSPLOWO2_01_FULL_47_25 TaxID=1802402 RepID=A0A1F7UPY4_9BACT|nr:MAG: Methyltransferase type 11 [Parcubacteria group bacterium GW2011_GWA2_46_9]OGL61020.1 MAG: hypothetical protein A2752_00810 [Candidatus Uhrbacteria bacterium RIFCSPHIGHO2_01_FULL_46_23]OGL69232.1 MAG: hypothetical protein A3D60_05015 [Candidatus Uhrbacteria bacterium RIFCSPHIGHO2_02_FULL_47_29]OGL80295.1 MAG: hypothetical protein A2936_02920 [Candidatus Uhrbacteria bacterium RIFCSPLOWO2_01_FULL_47_25]OGL85370.1 MAG: hypothetical protein A3I37_00825 [Candidatus Uhrbacteria bacterium RIFCS
METYGLYNHNDRLDRAKFVTQRFRDALQQAPRVLDVGCWNNDLKNIIGPKVYGVDIAGKPDKIVNLEKEKIPFADQSFDCVVCADVLEHLDNLYDVFDDLLRISKKFVIISLPNNLDIITRLMFLFNRPMRFYGLPAIKPNDRHKWIFSYQEAERFVASRTKVRQYSIQSFPSFPNRWYFRNPIFALLQKLYPRLIQNFFAKAYWCLLTIK